MENLDWNKLKFSLVKKKEIVNMKLTKKVDKI